MRKVSIIKEGKVAEGTLNDLSRETCSVAQSYLGPELKVNISTVLLAFKGYFETLVFDDDDQDTGVLPQFERTYDTYEEALKGHNEVVAEVENLLEARNGQ